MVDRKQNKLSKLTINNSIGEVCIHRLVGLDLEQTYLKKVREICAKSGCIFDQIFKSAIVTLLVLIQKMTVPDRYLPILKSIRGPLAEYQEKRGIAQEPQTYFSLMYIITQMLFGVMIALFQMIQNLTPLLDALLIIVRYIVDKAIDILETEEDRTMKTIVFAVQFISLFGILMVINGIVLLPLFSLFMVTIYKLRKFVF